MGRTCSIQDCEKRHHAKGLCHLHYCGQFREAHREERAAYDKAYRTSHRSLKSAIQRKYYADNYVERIRPTIRLRKYGLTEEQFQGMLQKQGGRCAICRTDVPGGRGGKSFATDHDHVTGIVRGLLCQRCNQAI